MMLGTTWKGKLSSGLPLNTHKPDEHTRALITEAQVGALNTVSVLNLH